MEDLTVLIVLFGFGLIIGSFLNVVILRWGTGMRISRGRSKCFSCSKDLSWYELVPVLSYVALRGRCRGCRSRISWQYPTVELLSGFALVGAYLCIPISGIAWVDVLMFVLAAVMLFLYIVIGAYDLRHKVIPDPLSFAAAFVALGALSLQSFARGYVDLYQVVAGPALFLFFFAFWFGSKGKWMGLGDGKLALSVGWFLGMGRGIAALLLAFWIGTVVVLAIMAFERVFKAKKRLGMRSEVPLGPFIIVGFILVFVFSLDLQSLLSFLAV